MILTLFTVVAITLFVLIAAYFASNVFIVQRQIIVEKPAPEIYQFVRFLGNHTSFSKWVTKRAAEKQGEIKGDGVVGFKQPWYNYEEKAGVGELEIKHLVTNSSVRLVHHYFKPVRGTGESEIILEKKSDSETLIQWRYYGYTKYPFNLITSVLNMDKIIGRDLDICLDRLNKTLTN